MADLIALSTKVVDAGRADESVNRTTGELSEIADGLAMVESFSHVVAWNSGDGLVCFDTSHVNTGQQVVDSIRNWTSDPFNALVYTHGHVDHVGGSVAFGANAAALGHKAPRVIGHKNVQRRFDRYRYTNDWNVAINARQFGGIRGDLNSIMNDLRPADGAPRLSDFIPQNTLDTTDVVDKFASMKFGDSEVEFHHGKC
jgi:glyoxylase-like metal-dependent hydrolase (beta-lactamase superfamily II)